MICPQPARLAPCYRDQRLFKYFRKCAPYQCGRIEHVTGIGGSFYVLNNPALNDLSGFLQVTSILGELNISGNTALHSLHGLDNITGIPYLTIMDNGSNLDDCAVQSICDYLDGGGLATISNNAFGCNNRAQVQAACLALPVQLTAFSGQAVRRDILLQWKTAQEQNFDHFEVEQAIRN